MLLSVIVYLMITTDAFWQEDLHDLKGFALLPTPQLFYRFWVDSEFFWGLSGNAEAAIGLVCFFKVGFVKKT